MYNLDHQFTIIYYQLFILPINLLIISSVFCFALNEKKNSKILY